jgi:hypothetical protein
MHWTVEWKIYADNPAAAPRIVRTTVSEQTVLRDALPSAAVQGQDAGLLHVLIQQIPRATYATLSLDSTLREALVDRTMIEFPTLCLVTLVRLSEFSLAVQSVDLEEEEKATIMVAQPQEADNGVFDSPPPPPKQDTIVETTAHGTNN